MSPYSHSPSGGTSFEYRPTGDTTTKLKVLVSSNACPFASAALLPQGIDATDAKRQQRNIDGNIQRKGARPNTVATAVFKAYIFTRGRPARQNTLRVCPCRPASPSAVTPAVPTTGFP